MMPPDGKRLIQRQWLTYDPIRSAQSPNLACNDPGSTAPLYAHVAAGSTITAFWNFPWAHDTGPLTVYMTECPGGDCSSFTDVKSAEWFKIYEAGFSVPTGRGTWATQKHLVDNNNGLTVKIPAKLKAGNYLIRHETIVSYTASSLTQ
jgi:lytic cellulose monooxygenase (C1-hydroxylating)